MQNTLQTNVHRRKMFSVKQTLLIMLVLLLAVIAWSSFRVYTEGTAAMSAFETLDSQINNGEYESAMSTERDLANHLEQLNKELKGFHWDMLGALPVIGDDVRCARGLADIGDKLVNKGVDPVVVAAKDALPKDSSDVLGAITRAPDKISTLVQKLGEARKVVKECSDQAKALPEAHIAQLKDASTQVKENITEVEDTISSIESVTGPLG